MGIETGEDATLGGEARQSGAAGENGTANKKKALVLAVAGLVVVVVIVAIVAAANNGSQLVDSVDSSSKGAVGSGESTTREQIGLGEG